MHENLIKDNTSINNTFPKANLIEIQLVRAEPQITPSHGTKQQQTATPDKILFWLPFSLITFLMIVAFRLSNARKVTQHRSTSAKTLDLVPCKKCQYFKNNPYLKCAIHPTTALTEEAINCSDYSPNKEHR
ncbi:MAG: hypothetical protein KME49_04585 [Brasilonema octagenarum HA4186-MV1]|nr:hypothetical protein [Brasilonema octagenarum]MBW4624793.1 hypothetical protein [Brasilonema octagenarum HA4186-MV1]